MRNVLFLMLWHAKEGISKSFFLLCAGLLIASSQNALSQNSSDPPFHLPSSESLQNVKSAKIETSAGTMFFELFPEDAPWHVANFKYLADKKFYTDLPFHLLRENYIIQGGSPSRTNLNSGPGYSLPPEFNDRKHERGALGMARFPDVLNLGRRSHGSQFHILMGKAEHMDGSFTVFGKMIAGDEVLKKLKVGDKILGVEVYTEDH
jgi:cyclophilin family peptidyl-prolyl cis-trans isomerase